MKRKYQIFISSTFNDLENERIAAIEAVYRTYNIPIGMEMFTADGRGSWDIIKDAIDQSDYYVLILGKRYGSIINDGSGMSFTEKEYRYAVDIKMPVLAFVSKDNSVDEDDLSSIEKLNNFRNYVKGNGRNVSFWENKDELAAQITASLCKLTENGNRPGWIRGADVDKLVSENEKLKEENNKLILENYRLKSDVNEQIKSPQLSVSLDADYDIKDSEDYNDFYKNENDVKSEDNCFTVKYKYVSGPDWISRLIRYEWEPDFENYGVTKEAVEEYNKNLPDEDDVKKSEEKYIAYHNIRQNGFPISVTIENTGKGRATSVRAILRSDSVSFYKIKDLALEDAPEEPVFPEDPFNAYRLKKMGYTNSFSKMLVSMNNTKLNENVSKLLKYSPLLHESYFQKKWSVVAYDHELDITDDEIPNLNGSLYLDKIYCVPDGPGEHTIECELYCNECTEPKAQKVIINAVE